MELGSEAGRPMVEPNVGMKLGCAHQQERLGFSVEMTRPPRPSLRRSGQRERRLRGSWRRVSELGGRARCSGGGFCRVDGDFGPWQVANWLPAPVMQRTPAWHLRAGYITFRPYRDDEHSHSLGTLTAGHENGR